MASAPTRSSALRSGECEVCFPLTGWPRGLVNMLVLLMGAGLAMDLSGWWIARLNGAVVPMIVVGGFVFATSVGLSLLLTVADLWRPNKPGFDA